jgi:flagellar hook-associated protein 1 FlgK
VVGKQAYALTTANDATTGLKHINNGQVDVTADFTGGSLGGTLQARDQDLPSLLSSLDTLAFNLAGALNTAHSDGFDLNGNTGTNLFVPPAQVSGAARNLQLQITDPSQLAASSDANPGGNGNLTALLAVADTPVVNGQTPGGYYSNLVFQTGNMVAKATSAQTASQPMLQQLQSQRDAISGVSLDEEATSLIQYQRAFQAAARVVNTIDECLQTALQIGTK